jgi:hypothetical protein
MYRIPFSCRKAESGSEMIFPPLISKKIRIRLPDLNPQQAVNREELEQLIAKTRAAIEKAREAKAKEASRYSEE